MEAQPHRSPSIVQRNGWMPPIQLRPTGQPISIADSVVSAVVLAIALAIISWAVGFNPTRV